MATDEQATFLAKLQETGLLDHLDDDQINAAWQELREGAPADTMLYALPDIVKHLDTEGLWVPSTILELVTDLITIARGHFQPTSIRISPSRQEEGQLEWNDEMTFTLTFRLDGQDYMQMLANFSDYIDLSFIATFNQALVKQGNAGRYYWIDTNDQCAEIIFLTERQYETLRGVYIPTLKPLRAMYLDPKDLE